VDTSRLIRRITWMMVVGVFAAMAIAAPVKIAGKHVGRSQPAGSTYRGDAVVRMAGLKFAPNALVVKKGTTVLFDNNDVAPHTITEDSAGGVDSGVLKPSASFRLVIDRRLVYHCAIHPFMKATIDLAG
jgi:plastocyanin